MCLGIPGLVVEFSTQHPDLARVDVEGVIRDINMALLEDDPAVPGDWILIHLGFALQKMTEAEVQDARSTLAVLGEGGLDGDPFAGFSFDVEPAVPELSGDHQP
jgi:hydrogenase expression/formation protein HypC